MVDLSNSPINTFKESCSRYHETEGNAYSEGFAQMSDDSLKEIISMMMNRPARLTPGQIDIAAMTTYNKIYQKQKTFCNRYEFKIFS